MSFKQTYGPWALIAGASEGIGLALATKLAARGLNLVLVARNMERLKGAAREVADAGASEVRTIALDLTAADMLERIAAETRGLDVGLLAYIAGGVGPSQFLDQTPEAMEQAVRLNAIAPTSLCRHFAPGMAARGRGGIILGGAGVASAGSYNFAVYAGAKAYMQIMGETLWFELQPHGVSVLNVMIGATRTPAAARLGIQFDGPGISEIVMSPEQVAQGALDNLENGPTWFPAGFNADLAGKLCTIDRKVATETMSGLMMQTTKH